MSFEISIRHLPGDVINVIVHCPSASYKKVTGAVFEKTISSVDIPTECEPDDGGACEGSINLYRLKFETGGTAKDLTYTVDGRLSYSNSPDHLLQFEAIEVLGGGTTTRHRKTGILLGHDSTGGGDG